VRTAGVGCPSDGSCLTCDARGYYWAYHRARRVPGATLLGSAPGQPGPGGDVGAGSGARVQPRPATRSNPCSRPHPATAPPSGGAPGRSPASRQLPVGRRIARCSVEAGTGPAASGDPMTTTSVAEPATTTSLSAAAGGTTTSFAAGARPTQERDRLQAAPSRPDDSSCAGQSPRWRFWSSGASPPSWCGAGATTPCQTSESRSRAQRPANNRIRGPGSGAFNASVHSLMRSSSSGVAVRSTRGLLG
jgi:hypothetical protein